MAHHHEQTYNLTDLRSYCLASGYLAEAERLELYLALQREPGGTAEDLVAHLALDPSFLVLPAYG